MFDFNVVYRESSKLYQADVLSRAFISSMSVVGNNLKEVENKIMRFHENFGHRKTITNILRDHNIKFSFEKLNEILSKCETCLMKDKQVSRIQNMLGLLNQEK
ncbi:hypothetical protein DMUE_3340 [Dictyocoela muelleri]|nr:hypothetical protein DMUE_3340 [Dictyocoela muelleri]